MRSREQQRTRHHAARLVVLRLRVDQQARIAGFQVSLQELTPQQAVIRISRGGDGGG